MGLIEDIADLVPKVQKRIEEDGIDFKKAISIELEILGYMPKKEGECKFEINERSKNNDCSRSR